MADAVVTVKLSTDELSTLKYALVEASTSVTNRVSVMSPKDGRETRAMLIKMGELRKVFG